MAELRHDDFVDTELEQLRREVATLSQDNSRLRRAEAVQSLQLDELHHRLKNTMAAVQSIALHTWESTKSENFPETFAGRLRAYERSLSLRDGEQGSTDIDSVIRFELDAYAGEEDGSRYALDGPDLILTRRAAAALEMAVHELATNAAKYGAFSRPDGRVEVAWNMSGYDSGQVLRIVWIETGGPQVKPPERRGFGTRLLEQALAGELGAKVNLGFPPEGVRCEVTLPWDRVSAG